MIKLKTIFISIFISFLVSNTILTNSINDMRKNAITNAIEFASNSVVGVNVTKI